MSSKVTVSAEEVKKIAKLSNLPLREEEVELFATQFSQTIEIVNELSEINTESITPTYQVTGLSNITRPDVVQSDRVFTQKQALSQSKQNHQGFFIVNRVIDAN